MYKMDSFASVVDFGEWETSSWKNINWKHREITYLCSDTKKRFKHDMNEGAQRKNVWCKICNIYHRLDELFVNYETAEIKTTEEKK